MKHAIKLSECVDSCVSEWIETYSNEALQGNIDSMLIYSKLLLRGSNSTPKDTQQSLYWLQKACKKNPEAAFRLGQIYSKGKYVTQDKERAYFYLKIGASFQCKCGNLKEEYHNNLISHVYLCYPYESTKALDLLPLTAQEQYRFQENFSKWRADNLRVI